MRMMAMKWDGQVPVASPISCTTRNNALSPSRDVLSEESQVKCSTPLKKDQQKYIEFFLSYLKNFMVQKKNLVKKG